VTEAQLSQSIENLLVARNPRNMKTAQAALTPGYYLRAAEYLRNQTGNIIIGTGFPVTDTFETDGPVGAIALYNTLKKLGAAPILACAPPLSTALAADYQILALTADNLESARIEARDQLAIITPVAIVCIERPGLSRDGRYYNMRGEDISTRCAYFDPFLNQALCPSIAIGDGGNEIGMGNIREAINTLDINASVTRCDELLVADVSNWGAYGLIAFLALWSGENLLGEIAPEEILAYLSAKGSVDGVTRLNTLTEDGMEASEGLSIINSLRQLVAEQP
jgi:hypothetical protein